MTGSAAPDRDPAPAPRPEFTGVPTGPAASSRRRLWVGLKRVAPWLLAAVVLLLIARQARSIDWPTVWQALRAQPRTGLAVAVALALCSYAVFASYDLIGRHVARHRVAVGRTLGIAATCYAFNVNFGAIVGALAVKLRLYGRAGLEAGVALRVIGLSIVTNWLGYLALGGGLLVLAPPPMPADWPLVHLGVRAVGAAMLAGVVAYLLLCARGGQGGRTVAWRGHELTLPDGRVALWQLAVAAANWALMGAIVWVLLGQRVAYPAALGVLLLAAVAGVITHVPAGLGVIEAVFLACLGGQVAQGTLLAALLAYRASYYLLPLALAAVGYVVGESRSRTQRSTG